MPQFAGKLLAQGSVVSKPVGTGILPGAGVEGTEFRSSLLFTKIIPYLIQWGINLAIALAVIAIIIGGYQYITAYGDDEKRQAGTRTLQYAVIGLAIALTAYGIVSIVTQIQLT